MAGPVCMNGDGNQAVFVGTMLQTGDAVALCDECLVPWAAAVLNVMTGVDPAPFLEAISTPEVTTPGDDDGEQGEPEGDPGPVIGRTKDGHPVGRSRAARGSGADRSGAGSEPGDE